MTATARVTDLINRCKQLRWSAMKTRSSARLLEHRERSHGRVQAYENIIEHLQVLREDLEGER